MYYKRKKPRFRGFKVLVVAISFLDDYSPSIMVAVAVTISVPIPIKKSGMIAMTFTNDDPLLSLSRRGQGDGKAK
jgi:hypothetical protein